MYVTKPNSNSVLLFVSTLTLQEDNAHPMSPVDVATPISPLTNSLPHHNSGTTSNPLTPVATSSGISRTFERLSLKSKSKNQSFFKFFRGHGSTASSEGNNGGDHVTISESVTGSGEVTVVKHSPVDDVVFRGEGSSGSDHEDPFSVSHNVCMLN